MLFGIGKLHHKILLSWSEQQSYFHLLDLQIIAHWLPNKLFLDKLIPPFWSIGLAYFSSPLLSFVLLRAVMLFHHFAGNGRPDFLSEHGFDLFLHRSHEVMLVQLCDHFSQVVHLVVSLRGVVYLGQD